MSEKYSARELAFHYLARQPDKLSEAEYLKKLIDSETTFERLLQSDSLKTWQKLGEQL